MKRYLLLSASIILFLIISCESKNKNFSYKDKLVVSVNTMLNDSILNDKTIECFVYLDMNDRVQVWKKYFYFRDYQKLNDPAALIFDTTVFKVRLNDQLQITKVLNWNKFFKKYKRKVEGFVGTYPTEQRAMMRELLKNVAYDSLLIISKNIKDMELFNKGLYYLQNPIGAVKSMKIKIRGNITELTGEEKIPQENLDYSISKLKENLPDQNAKMKFEKPELKYLIAIDNKKNKVIHAEQTIFLYLGKDTLKHIITINRYVPFNFKQRR